MASFFSLVRELKVDQALYYGVAFAFDLITCHNAERKKMKLEDEKMTIERKTERENEKHQGLPMFFAVMCKVLPHEEPTFKSLYINLISKTKLKHFTHPHELQQVCCKEKFTCASCGEEGENKRYTCYHKKCTNKFDLHIVCAASPTLLYPNNTMQNDNISWESLQYNLTQTSAHKPHQVKEIYRNAKFTCDHCKTEGNGMRYHCEDCNIHLHQICAKRPTRINSFMHPQHELQLQTKPVLKACALCHDRGNQNSRMHGCDKCSFYLHPSCSQWPQYLIHDLHCLTDTQHPLQLKCRTSSSKKNNKCDADCGRKCYDWIYNCDKCDVVIHPKCMLSKFANNNANYSTGKQVECVVKFVADLAVGYFIL